MYLLGYDLGTSSIKVALYDADQLRPLGTAASPDGEMTIEAPAPDWAEQDPRLWWEHLCLATRKLLQQHPEASTHIEAIGMSYQMHGLVLTDEAGEVLRPSIIWCDSRAVEVGRAAGEALTDAATYGRLLNKPGNFTASKLAWVKAQEPDRYARARFMLLPGDYIAFRMTGLAGTTVSGLSEGILWDFQENTLAEHLLDHYGLDPGLVPPLLPTFGDQGNLRAAPAAELGLPPGIPVTYRAGDQPNNALSLQVLQPGEVAATGGTSGVVYGVTDQLRGDRLDRVNSFAHVNHRADQPRVGVLLCINGAGSMYAWLRAQIAEPGMSYPELESAAAQVPVGAEGLRLLPFGNGAERLLQNQPIGAHLMGISVARHRRTHLYRAGLEGIAFAFAHGMAAMAELGIDLQVMRVGNDNLFQSKIFSQSLADLTQSRIEVRETTGAVGAAIAAGVARRGKAFLQQALGQTPVLFSYQPQATDPNLSEAFQHWQSLLGLLRQQF